MGLFVCLYFMAVWLLMISISMIQHIHIFSVFYSDFISYYHRNDSLDIVAKLWLYVSIAVLFPPCIILSPIEEKERGKNNLYFINNLHHSAAVDPSKWHNDAFQKHTNLKHRMRPKETVRSTKKRKREK